MSRKQSLHRILNAYWNPTGITPMTAFDQLPRKFLLTLHRDGIVKIWDVPWMFHLINPRVPKKSVGM